MRPITEGTEAAQRWMPPSDSSCKRSMCLSMRFKSCPHFSAVNKLMYSGSRVPTSPPLFACSSSEIIPSPCELGHASAEKTNRQEAGTGIQHCSLCTGLKNHIMRQHTKNLPGPKRVAYPLPLLLISTRLRYRMCPVALI